MYRANLPEVLCQTEEWLTAVNIQCSTEFPFKIHSIKNIVNWPKVDVSIWYVSLVNI